MCMFILTNLADTVAWAEADLARVPCVELFGTPHIRQLRVVYNIAEQPGVDIYKP